MTRRVREWLLGIGQNRTHMLVFSKDLKKIFTANGNGSASDSISVVDASAPPPPTDWKITVIPVSDGPETIELSPDGREVWTATYGDGGISVIDAATNKVIRTLNIQTKRSNRLKFTPDGKMVLVSDSQGGQLVVLDAAAGKVIKRINIGKPPVTGIQVVPDGSRAYVAAEGDDNIAVIDLKTVELTGRIFFPPARSRPDGMAWAAMR